MCCSSSRIKRSRNSSSMMEFRSSSSMVDFIHEIRHNCINLKKKRVDYMMNQQILNFSSSKFTSSSSSSSLSGNENRASPEINELLENKYYSAWRRIMSSTEINELIENKYYSAWRRRIMSSSADVEKSNPSVVPKHLSQHGFVREGVRRSCIDDDHRRKYYGATALTMDVNKSVWSPTQSDITEQQSSKMSSGSDGGEKGGVDVSDNKSVRAEMLKKRFSQIIVKETQLQKVDRSDDLKLDDSVKMQVDKQLLMEKKKKKLKEAQIAAEAESKRELQRKREASRKALLELERTVEVNDNIKTMKDFAMLLGYPQNSAACVCNEIGWYGDRVVYCRKTMVEEELPEVLFKERCIRWSSTL